MIAARVQAKPIAAAKPARAAVVVRAQKTEAKKPQVAAAVMAVLASAVIALTPAAANAEASVKQVVCASNPTAKVCLKDSAK
ncbi:hypothetical protein GPECTOR_58g576 [Gonium pectorale]|uniref:Uncharacterized protein n=1 Tax=Gonium pectorale TaxID=33097 RepID=A0A150G5K5_GONPE|nr:hypothetical protein GPECTOR_58g576 [Gonium pectorale]|eukprot:KXZ45127.1 hypothetical protein GPECTOR_58g576 [Gonium pectorale]